MIRGALSHPENAHGYADVIMGDLACNVLHCGNILAALTPLLNRSATSIAIITVVGSSITPDVAAQIWANGAKTVSLVHLFASKKQERALVVSFLTVEPLQIVPNGWIEPVLVLV